MKYVTIFHANLNYAFLEPYKYERVIRSSYETIIDTFREDCPQAKYVFEASGFTIDQMAKLTPDVLEKLKDAVQRGQCEFMGSPYAHPMLANFPEEDGRWANEFAMRTFEKHLGFRPVSGWNPECSWMQYVPNTFRDVGYKYLTLDFESYMICNHKEYGWTERNRARDIAWGGNLPPYDLDPDQPELHFPFRDIVPGLGGFCRSDRLAGKSIGLFLGRCTMEDYMATVKQWSGKKNKGALVIVADDAEYCGTTAYFYVKHYGEYDKSFAPTEHAREILGTMVNRVSELGELITFEQACQLSPVDEPFYVEDRFAWHRTYADVWARTPESLRYDPLVAVMRNGFKDVEPKLKKDAKTRQLVEKFWFHLTCAENSDGRWPPPPERTCPFNREWVENEMVQAQRALGQIRKLVK